MRVSKTMQCNFLLWVLLVDSFEPIVSSCRYQFLVSRKCCKQILFLVVGIDTDGEEFFAYANFHDYADEMTTHFESATYRFILKAIELDNYPKYAYEC